MCFGFCLDSLSFLKPDFKPHTYIPKFGVRGRRKAETITFMAKEVLPSHLWFDKVNLRLWHPFSPPPLHPNKSIVPQRKSSKYTCYWYTSLPQSRLVCPAAIYVLLIFVVLTLIQSFHFFATIPSGGLVSTGPFPTSDQFVLRLVPLLSW